VAEAQISFASAEDVIGGTQSIECEKRNKDVGIENDHVSLILKPFAPTEDATGYPELHE
jgi:hypothetical protein